MKKEDFLRKIVSRKFWVLLVGFVGSILAFAKLDQGSVEQITTIIMSFGAMISFVLGESYVDGKRLEGDSITNIIKTEEYMNEDKEA